MKTLELLILGLVVSSIDSFSEENIISSENEAIKKETTVAKVEKKTITADDGLLHGYARIHHIFDGKDNGFDKETGSTFGFGLGYGVEVVNGLKIGAEYYGVTDTGLTDEDKTVAYGQFMNTIQNPNELDYGDTWGVHIVYNLGNKMKATIARSQFKSPLTKIEITHVPNMYEYARFDTSLLGGKASLAYITKMAYGSRSATDFGLIGEKTGTAGMALSPFILPSDPYLKRGNYYSIDDTLGDNDSNGIFVVGYETKLNNVEIKAWNFVIDDIANNLYLESNYKYGLFIDTKLSLSAQVFYQNILNDSFNAEYGGTMLGAKASMNWKSLEGTLAYNTKDSGGVLNAWGANPGYTSSIFSRNEYRSDVNAYKATLVYKPMTNLVFTASHANYGQSTTLGRVSQADATETDIVIVYKPEKNIMIKLFNVKRTSEYNTALIEKKQNQTRIIMNYAF